MITITVSKTINGKNVSIDTNPIDEDSASVAELNDAVQDAIARLLDKE